MKNIFLFIALFIYSGCFAQNKLTTGTVKANRTTYLVKKSSHGNNITVFGSRNKYAKGIPYPKNPNAFPILSSDIQVDNQKAKDLILKTLKNKLTVLKNNKETLDIVVVFEQDGTLRDISYIILKDNTLITPVEIEQIENKLKSQIRVRFTGKDYLDYVAISYKFPTITF